MFPVNQQNLAFLSISNDNANNIKEIESVDNSLNGFENLFSAYVSSARDENIAGLGNTGLPLSAALNPGKETTDGLSISVAASAVESAETVTVAVASLLSNHSTGTTQESATPSNTPLSTINEQAATINVSLASNTNHGLDTSFVEGKENDVNNFYRSADAPTIPATNDRSGLQDIIAVRKDNTLRSANTSSENERLNNGLQNIKHIEDGHSVVGAAPAPVQSTNVASSVSIGHQSTIQEQSSDNQANTSTLQNTNNTRFENDALKYQTENNAPLPVNQYQVTSPVAQVTDPRLLNPLKNSFTATHETTLPSSFPNQSDLTRSIQQASRAEPGNVQSEGTVKRTEFINLQVVEADPVKNSNIKADNNNSSGFISLDNVTDKQTIELSSVNGNTDNLLESKNIAGLPNYLQSEHDSQLTGKQTLLDLNKVTVLGNTVSATDNGVDITNAADIAKQLVLANQNGTQQIRLSITPEHLGAVDINVQDANDGVSIHIVTQNIVAKESLEMFIPRLRDMLEQNGVALQDATIEYRQQENDNSYGKSDQQENKTDGNEIPQQDESGLREHDSRATRVSLSDHILDAFA